MHVNMCPVPILILFFYLVSGPCSSQVLKANDTVVDTFVTIPTFQGKMDYLHGLLQDAGPDQDLLADKLHRYRDSWIAQERWEEALSLTNVLGNYFIYVSINHKKAYEILEGYTPFILHNTDREQISFFYMTHAEAATFMQRYKESLSILDQGIAFMEKH